MKDDAENFEEGEERDLDRDQGSPEFSQKIAMGANKMTGKAGKKPEGARKKVLRALIM